ncbi:MAG: VOC family protein [Fimbriimonadaceae bacterium]
MKVVLHEVILFVDDMQKCVEFYRDVLDLKVVFPADKDSFAEEVWVTFDTGPVVLALHGGSDGDFGDDAPELTFAVDSITEAAEFLKGKGVEVGEPHEVTPGLFVCDFEDPAGNSLNIEGPLEA